MKLICVTPHSATLELDNPSPYFSGKPFPVILNGSFLRMEERNVFSLFSLPADTSCTVSASGEEMTFRTERESFILNVKDFFAVGDGAHDDTEAFAAAIACLPERSTLYVPAGTYFIKPLFLKSNMTLWLEKGAELSGSPDRESYPVLPGILPDAGREKELNLGTWQGEEAACFASLITAVHCKNITVMGEGTINGNALAGDWYTDHRIMRIAWRPRGMFFNRCENIRIQGITVKETPSWNIHPYFCKNTGIYDVTLTNPPHMPTTDGIDPDSCENVEIIGVKISVGDDCIAIKSGTLSQAKKYKTPCRNVTIRNCLMLQGHGGVVLGSELSGGIEQISVSQCIFQGTDRGLRIKTRRGRGRIGITSGISFSRISMENVKVPFVINMYYNMGDETGHTEYVWTTKKLPVDERTPFIGSFTFEDMTCTGVEYCAGAFYGLPEAPIESVTLRNVSFSYNKQARAGYPDMMEKNEAVKNQGLYFRFVKSICLENVTVNGCDGEPVLTEHCGSTKKAPAPQT